MVQNNFSKSLASFLASSLTSLACVVGLALPLAALPTLVMAQTATTATVAAPTPETNAVPAAPAAAKPAAKADSPDNPYGLEALWKTSDWIAKSVLLLLLIMSVASWYILVVKLLEQTKMSRQAKAAAKDFWSAGTVEQGAAVLKTGSPFKFIADAGLEATKKHHGLMGHVPLNDWVTMSIQRAVDRIQSSVQSGLSVLATVGSISPFVGLFGTVWGIYGALTAIGISGQASIDKVAGPVGESLIMTAIGLAVAVPAVLSYNWLVGRNKAVMEDVRAFGSDLHAVILGSAKK
jgi:biopolymer transport protein ExbB